jgi:PAS domain S-box-containing protein
MLKIISDLAILNHVAGTAEGITEDRRQETLLKTGALQSAIFNSANFSSIATDAKGVIQIFNVGAERMLGYTAADVMNKITPAEISDPQEVIARAEALSVELGTPITPGFEALVFKAARGIEDIYELTYIRKDGSRFPAVVSVTALRDDENSIIGYLLIGTDNTARKQAEEALLKAGALQKAIFDSANFSSIATDAKGVIQIFNVGAERMLGYTAAEVMNKIKPSDISDPQEVIARAEALSVELGTAIAPGFEALVFKASRGIEDIYELTYIRKDGSRFPAIVSVTALRDDQDTIIGYLLIGTDNTARKQAEEALLKAGALQKAIFDSANFSSIATDAKGVIQIFNVGAERMLGYAAADVMNKITPAEISDPQEVVARAEALSLELDTPITPGFEALVFKASRGIEDIYELTYIRKDGSRFPAVVSVTALRDDESTIIGYLLIGTDNTARKQAEEALLKAGALQKAIFDSANFSSIATDAKGVIQIFNVGAERMLGYAAADVMNKITPAEISDSQEVIARAEALSVELGTPITPGFEALVFKASRGIEDIYELTYIRKDGSRFPAIVSVTALRDDENTIIGYLLIGTDNTARKQAEEALLKAGALQSAIFNSANFSSIATDAKGVIQIFNVGAERMLGYAAADVMNKITPAEISDPQEVIARAEALSVELGTPIAPGFEALVFKAARGIEDIYELTYIRKDGSRFPAVVSVTALRDAQDTIIGYLLIGTDNTARKQAEEALLKAGALQSAIFNSANFSSIATDAKGVIQIFNVGAERMLGYAAADVMNKITPADISDPQEVIVRAKALSAELGTPITPGFEALVFKASRGIEDIYELTYIRKDGSRFPAVVSVTALRDAQDAIIGYLLIGTDNTARKQVEAEQKLLDQRLRDQQFYTRSLIESNLDAIMTTDPFGIISDVNKQMEALTGCTRDELIGAPFKNYFTDPERAEAAIKLVLSEKKVANYELTARARDGKETVVSYNAMTFYDRDRRLQGVFAAARDITERKRLDQVLQEKNIELESATSVAEKANLAKSDFLSSMSHELRSPLNAILGFAQLMESDSPPATPAQKESIAQILQAGWHLLKLINEILDLAKVESRQVPMSEEPVSLAEVMLECQAMIEPQAQQRDIKLSFPKFDIPCFVRADRTRLKQILINLLSNAIKYNVKQGTVEVKCAATTPERIRINIIDSGAGLYPEQLAQLFQPFNRLGQEAGGEEGTGIGLVVAKRLVELMGGVIGVESTVGVGSVFWFELISVAEIFLSMEGGDAAAMPQPHVPRRAQLHTVLYVEDNPANLKLVEQIIARHPDMRLLTAVNGNDGIEIARTSQPDVILMDINLPGINGFEAMKILHSDPATAHIPVIAVSANAMPLDVERGLKAGFFRYITKPIKVNELMEALDVALEFAESSPVMSE